MYTKLMRKPFACQKCEVLLYADKDTVMPEGGPLCLQCKLRKSTCCDAEITWKPDPRTKKMEIGVCSKCGSVRKGRSVVMCPCGIRKGKKYHTEEGLLCNRCWFCRMSVIFGLSSIMQTTYHTHLVLIMPEGFDERD